MMPRTLEPELMDDQAQARAYAEEDFSESNNLFLECFRRLYPGHPTSLRVLDLGCGPADISLRFARAYPHVEVDALDGSAAMLAHAAQSLAREPQLAARVRLLHERLPSPRLIPGSYGILLSNSLLHHLHTPALLWDSIQRAAAPGAAVLVMDLFRPDSEAAVAALVNTYTASAPDILRRDFRNSLRAAFTPAEVEAQLAEAGLGQLRVARVSDRHLAVTGYL